MRRLDDFPASGAAVIRRDPQTDDTKPTYKALNELMLDCFKKVRESRGKRKRAAAREELAAGAGQVEDKKEPTQKRGLPARGAGLRIDTQLSFTSWIQRMRYTIHSLGFGIGMQQVSSQLPDGRKVREIIGLLEDLDPAAGDPLMIPPQTTHIRSDDELDAFLRLIETQPIKLLIVLHRDPAVRANSPPPAVCNASTYYFNLGRFDGPEYYMDEIEDSEEEVTRRTGADLEAKHKAAFHDAIHESDAGGGLRVLCYGEGDKLTGKQVVQFRAVVADYVTDLAARAAANTEAGGGLTNRQLVRRAVRHVKAEINGGVTYAALGLPQMEA
ncbi:hypothetical protein BGX38DRAFT_1273856 [Terfezia claveryi]|nr:hypothetical protein BGX38DRAFT_1273856 [Terfezia claveryi]